MIRYGLLIIYIIVLAVIASKDWFKGLCMLLVLTVFSQRPDMPRLLFNIPGMSPWNFCLVIVMLFWISQRDSEQRKQTPSHGLAAMFVLYCLLIIATGLAATIDAQSATGREFDAEGFFIDGLINPLKYAFMGFLFFDGALTRSRLIMTLISVVGGDLLYGVMMFKTLGLRVFTINYIDARRLTDKLIGLFANDLAQVLGFVIWAGLLVGLLFGKRWMRNTFLATTAAAVPPFLALKSRAGYFGLLAAGVVLGVLRYRSILILLPVSILVVWFTMASVRDRFTLKDEPGEEITAGRMTELWPPVLRQIPKSIIWGHGRYGILRAHCYEELAATGMDVPQHPHNAYLEMLLDAGILGMSICLIGMIGLIQASLYLVGLKEDALISTTGLVSMMALATIMTVGLSGASFYPAQSTLPYICLWGAVMRVRTEFRHASQQIPATIVQMPRRATPVNAR